MLYLAIWIVMGILWYVGNVTLIGGILLGALIQGGISAMRLRYPPTLVILLIGYVILFVISDSLLPILLGKTSSSSVVYDWVRKGTLVVAVAVIVCSFASMYFDRRRYARR